MKSKLEEMILRKINLSPYTEFLDYHELNSKNYYNLLPSLGYAHLAGYNNNESILKPISKTVIKIIKDEKIINGYCFYENNIESDIICITSGVFSNLMKYSLNCVERMGIMPQIGNVFNTKKEQSSTSMQIIDNRMQWITGLSDEKRINLAEQIYLLECLFIIYHEIGHKINGHTLLIENSKLFNAFNSFEMSNDNILNCDEDTLLDMQTLEMDADAYAANHLWRFARNYFSEISEPIFKELSNVRNLIELLTNALCIYHFFIEYDTLHLKENCNNNVWGKKHLPNLYRLILAIGALKETILEENGEIISRQQLNDVTLKAMIGFIRLFSKEVPNLKNEIDLIILEINEKSAPKQNEIKRNWNKIRKELLNYSYLDLAREYYE
ncbi:MAG: hypothetical protein AB9836_05235 [Aminipila sp.]